MKKKAPKMFGVKPIKSTIGSKKNALSVVPKLSKTPKAPKASKVVKPIGEPKKKKKSLDTMDMGEYINARNAE